MPTLFDSHDEFTEWFSKDIENHAENKGESNLNEHQIRRLHMILKPFMLRRIKKNVQNELGDKVCWTVSFAIQSDPHSPFIRRLRSICLVTCLLDNVLYIEDCALTFPWLIYWSRHRVRVMRTVLGP